MRRITMTEDFEKIPHIKSVKDLVPLLKEEYVIQDYIQVKQRYNELYDNIKKPRIKS